MYRTTMGNYKPETASSSPITIFSGADGGAQHDDGVTKYTSAHTSNSWDTNINTQDAPVPVAGTWKLTSFKVVVNTNGGTTTIKSQVNGSDGNQVVTFTTTTTGEAQDTTNTDTLANLDNIAYKITSPTTSGNINNIQWSSVLA